MTMAKPAWAAYRLIERVSHLLMLEAYLDDSGDEDVHAVSVGGAIGTKEAWTQFEEEWAFVRHAFSVVELHMTDMNASRKTFSCWGKDDPRKAEILKCWYFI